MQAGHFKVEALEHEGEPNHSHAGLHVYDGLLASHFVQEVHQVAVFVLGWDEHVVLLELLHCVVFRVQLHFNRV